MDQSKDVVSVAGEEKQSFLADIMKGLLVDPKYLSSKYFYDKTGDRLFQQIMHCPEYYLTRCEKEILSTQAADIAQSLKANTSTSTFDLIGLGAGDASKSVYLLREFLKENIMDTYYPVDISSNVISLLEKTLPGQIPQIRMKGFNGEYMEMLKQINTLPSKSKVVLFLGSNIGNFHPGQAVQFCSQLSQLLKKGDMLFIGFDLKKHPGTILNAYNDKQGFTRAFNLNLLSRMNRELNANFDTSQFEHFPTYDPETGTCKSFLISLKAQSVQIGNHNNVSFKENEAIQMEISQKYTLKETDQLADESGFEVVNHFFDARKWFVDCLWKCK